MKLIATKNYDPSTSASASTASLLAFTALDTTNLRHTFTVPDSGKVFVRLAFVVHGASTAPQILVGVLQSSTVIARVAPRYNIFNAATTTLNAAEATFTVTGLNPGDSLTWDAAYSVETILASTAIKWGGPNNTTANDAFGAFVYEIWDADPFPTNFTKTSITSGGALTVGTNNDKTGYRLSATGVDDVWDEVISGHLTAGTTGASLNSASSAGDPWNTSLPGSYTAGTAGYIVGNNINASISSRMATFTLPTNFSSLSIDASGRVDLGKWIGTAPLALSSQQVQAVVPDTQKVDVNTIKTNPVVNAGTITFPTGATLASTTNITAATGIDVTKFAGTTFSDTSGRVAAAFSTFFNVASPVLTTASINQTGDSYNRIGSNGSGLTALAPASTALSTAQWTNTRANNLDYLDTAISSRSIYDGSDTSGTTTLLSRLTDTRALILDNLNIGGPVASSDQITSIQNNTTTSLNVPENIPIPTSGTITCYARVYLTDEIGNMEAPDSAPTMVLFNALGTNLSSRLTSTTGVLDEVGVYHWEYTSTSTDTSEQILWEVTVVEGGVTRKKGATSWIVNTIATDFTSTDRTVLNAISGYVDDLESRLTSTRANLLDNLSNLNATVSSRLASASYVAPDNSSITAILEDTGTTLPGQITGLNNISTAQVRTQVDAGIAAVGLTSTITGRIDVATSTRLATSGYTAPSTDFTSVDRTKLEAIYNKLPSASYFLGTSNSSGVLDAGTITGNFLGSVGSISGIIFPSNFDSLQINSDGWISRVDQVSNVINLENHTPQTGDSYAVVTNATYGNAAIKTSVSAIDVPSAEKIADVTLRRSSEHIEASSNGDSLQLGTLYALIRMVNHSTTESGSLVIYKTDGSTLGTKTVSGSRNDTPISTIS